MDNLFAAACKLRRLSRLNAILVLTPSGRAPDQTQDISCESLNAERARLLAERDDLNTPLLSKTDAEREAELTQLNGKLYTVAKAQFDKSCPAAANGAGGIGSAVAQRGSRVEHCLWQESACTHTHVSNDAGPR